MEMITLSRLKKEALKDPEIKKEFVKLQPDYAIIGALVKARAKKGLTQKELAEKLGTKQSAISRFELGMANPTLSFLKNLADVLGCKLTINFK